MFDYPNKLDIIFDKLDLYCIKPIIVGGYIRDKILHLDSKDIDIELYGLDSLDTLENILQEFGDVNTVGKSFGVCKLRYEEFDLDFSLPRTDSKIAKGHKGFHVVTDKNLDFKSAASRRDFTINAMGYDVKAKKLLDPFNGQEDLKNGLLRAVDIKKFSEDPLRVLRGVGFCARFDFTMETKLFNECIRLVASASLDELAKERVFAEVEKILLKAKKPSIGFILLEKFKIFDFSHSILYALDRLADINPKNRLMLMLTLLSYDLKEEKMHTFLSKLSDEKSLLKQIALYVTALRNFSLEDVNSYKTYKLATQVNISKLAILYTALAKDKNQIASLISKAKELDVLTTQMPELLKGKDLIDMGLIPSKVFSLILKEAYKAQMQEVFTNTKDAKKYLIAYLLEKKLF